MSGDRMAFRDGFLSGDLAKLGDVRLAGSRCRACGIALFGRRLRCENCSSPALDHVSFADTGSIHSYTVQRYPPPQPNACPEPWLPRPLAWIDLDDCGPRILGPIRCNPDDAEIGGRVHLVCGVGWIDQASGAEVIDYAFEMDKRI